jgi:hypothetical protein
MVTPSKMGWMKFLYQIDIFGYAINCLAQSEFSAQRYDFVPPLAPAGSPSQVRLQSF